VAQSGRAPRAQLGCGGDRHREATDVFFVELIDAAIAQPTLGVECWSFVAGFPVGFAGMQPVRVEHAGSLEMTQEEVLGDIDDRCITALRTGTVRCVAGDVWRAVSGGRCVRW
jgi:hypothetical protein